MSIRLENLSKYRAPIYGFAIIWIAFFHGSVDTVDYSFGHDSLLWFKTIMSNGSVGVEVFLFLSGISLYFSFKNDSNLLSYLKKRTRRLFVPLFIVYGAFFGISKLNGVCIRQGHSVGFLDGVWHSGTVRRVCSRN